MRPCPSSSCRSRTACRRRPCCSTCPCRARPMPRRLVARIAPDPAADPVFQVYDMERQFRTMEMVAEHTDVPVPQVLWLETGDRGHRGPVLRHGADRRRRPARRAALHLRRQLVLRRRRRGPAAAGAERRRGAGRPAPADGGRTGRLPRPARRRATARCATTSGRQRAYYDWVAADGVRSPLDRTRASTGSRSTGPTTRDDAVLQLGRRPRRQHDVRGLRPGGRPRLGDGRRSDPARSTSAG